MKGFGFFLLVAGFLTGAFSTTLDVDNVNWTMFVIAAVAAVVGLLMVKRAESAHVSSERGQLSAAQQAVKPSNFMRNSWE